MAAGLTRAGQAMPDLIAMAAAAAANPEQARAELAAMTIPDDLSDVELRRRERVAANVIPPRFRDVEFPSFHPETPSQRLAFKAATRWVERVVDGKAPMVALIGPPGIGKSHLLYAAVKAVVFSNRPDAPVVRSWPDLADALRYGERTDEGKHLEAWEVRARLRSAKVLVIDEIRPTASTALDENELVKLASHAYDHLIPMLVTTNVAPLADVMGQAAASRFTQIVLDGKDYRQAA